MTYSKEMYDNDLLKYKEQLEKPGQLSNDKLRTIDTLIEIADKRLENFLSYSPNRNLRDEKVDALLLLSGLKTLNVTPEFVRELEKAVGAKWSLDIDYDAVAEEESRVRAGWSNV